VILDRSWRPFYSSRPNKAPRPIPTDPAHGAFKSEVP
jgi:hypothetical protein